MLTTYRRILAVPGALRFSATGLVARLPISMEGLGIVLLVVAVSDSYGYAGAVAGTVTIANAVASIFQGRYIDRLGQARVLPPLILAWGAALLLLVAAVHGEWPRWTAFAVAVLVGATLPPVSTCVRARWSHVLDEPRQVQTGYALESAVDEAVFIAGPILVTALATSWDPVAGLGAAVIAGVGGTLFLATQRATEPPGHPLVREVADRPRMPWRTVAPLAVVALGLGALFGSAEVTTVAFAEEAGKAGVTGVLLALWALGSLLAGLVTGAVHWQGGTALRLKVGTAALAIGMTPLALVGPIWLMGLMLFLAGFAIAPSLIATLSHIEQTVPSARLTEGMAFVHTGLAAGLAPGSAIAGVVVDAAGASPASLVSAGAGVVAALAAQTLPRAASRHPATVAGGRAPRA
jgi:predicted MFS family arabinose efflux permease